jgi:hypothetical protein
VIGSLRLIVLEVGFVGGDDRIGGIVGIGYVWLFFYSNL